MSSDPSTPASHRSLQYSFKPLNSSPLISPSPSRSSPLVPSSLRTQNQTSTSERRRLQFKSQSSLSRSSTLPSSSPSTGRQYLPSRTRSISGPSTTSSSRQTTRPQFTHPEDPQKQFLRERIKAKCIQRAQKARARAVKQRRYTGYSDRSSDGFEMDDDDDDEEEDNDDDIMSDELFRRIMAQTDRKTEHTYKLSYAQEVGSSFDPDMEDVEDWEQEVQGQGLDPSPVDWDDEELEAYAEECARQATLDDLADIPEEELFNLNDIDDILDESSNVADEMDLS